MESKIIEVLTAIVTIASFLAFCLPPADKFDGYPRFKPVYNAFLIIVDWIALNVRPWRRIAPSATDAGNARIDQSIKRVGESVPGAANSDKKA